VNIEAIEWCIDGWDERDSGDGRAAKAREQLAALVEAAGRAGALAAALAELLNGGRWSDGYGARKYALRLTGDEHAALHDLLAEAGPGAAGARDETTGKPLTHEERAIVYDLTYPCAVRLHFALGWLGALRAGGAGETSAGETEG
jgi:hypothetical protein